MSQESSERVKTFSIGFEEQDFSELHHARRVAEHVGADHHEFIVRPDAVEILPMLVDHYGEPYADSSAVPTYYVARETRKHVTVALNGDGGDESFAGYERYIAMGLTEKYRRIPSFVRESLIREAVNMLPTDPTRKSKIKSAQRLLAVVARPKAARYMHWMSTFNDELKEPLYTDSFRQQTLGANATGILENWFKRANGIGVVDTMLLTDQMTYLPNDLLVKVDIATMAVSLEARSPFLDHHVIEFAASLPQHLKLRRLTGKYLLKKVLRKLLPSENLTRRKMGFGVPIGHWFRGKMQPFLREVILSEKALGRGLFKPDAVKQLVDQHVRAERDYSHQLWTLLMLELWFNRFID
jgi:asparagine synthase (glutamine-hydrolysing)